MYSGLPRWCIGKEFSCQCRRHQRQGLIPELRRPLEEEMATHSSILAWKIPWTEEPHGLASMGSQVVRHDWAHTNTQMYRRTNGEHLSIHTLWPNNFTSLCSSNRYTCTFACADINANSVYIRTEWLTKAWCILKEDEKKTYVLYLYDTILRIRFHILKKYKTMSATVKSYSTQDMIPSIWPSRPAETNRWW